MDTGFDSLIAFLRASHSAGAMMVGIVIGGIARLSTNNLKLFEFSPEVFFFVLLPPIIFGK
jgi:hypothetical protein